eukprot:732527-Hanusia_phi.AAC.1
MRCCPRSSLEALKTVICRRRRRRLAQCPRVAVGLSLAGHRGSLSRSRTSHPPGTGLGSDRTAGPSWSLSCPRHYFGRAESGLPSTVMCAGLQPTVEHIKKRRLVRSIHYIFTTTLTLLVV